LAGLWAAPAFAQSQRVTFRVSKDSDEKVATVVVLNREGVPYVSLTELADKLGGGCRVFPERVQMDFARQSAWMQIGKSDVDASLNRFSLLHPVVREDDEVLIAVSDVGPFLTKAFRASVKEDAVPNAIVEPEPILPSSSTEPPSPADAEPVPLPEPSPEAVSEPVPPTPTESAPPEPPKAAGRRAVKTIVIDPGHGGSDNGCAGPGGTIEKNVSWAVAQALAKLLRERGDVTVALTREEDADLTPTQRANLASKNKGDLLISLHAASSTSPAAHGFSIFYSAAGNVAAVAADGAQKQAPIADYAAQNADLTSFLAAALIEASAAENLGIHEMPCRLLKDVSMPAALIEMGCLTSPAEEALLASDTHQTRLAQGIANGIGQFMAAQAGTGGTP
jgi:N-acetylmuramoyl-L-alanine amidase